MSSVKFNINKELLNYITNEGSFLFDNIDKLNLSQASEELLLITTLQIAKTFEDVSFYLPLLID
jgi:hypothetical protein